MRGRKPGNPKLLELTKARPGGGRQKYLHEMPVLDPEPGPELAGPDAELFRQLVGAAPRGLLAAIDRTLLTVFCQHVGIHHRAVAELAELTMQTDNGPRRHPLEKIALDQGRLLLPLAVELGLTATARQRIKLPALADDLGGWSVFSGA